MSKKYPFKDGPVSQSKLLDWLTEVLYPGAYRVGGVEKSLAKNRIRARIYQAHQKEKQAGFSSTRFSTDRKGQLKPRPFFEWAFEVRGWGRLRSIDNLPKDRSSKASNLAPLQTSLGSVTVNVVPDSYKALRKTYLEELESHRICNEENIALRAQIKRLKAELKEKRTKSREGKRHAKKKLNRNHS